jgi:hypothetical protein
MIRKAGKDILPQYRIGTEGEVEDLPGALSQLFILQKPPQLRHTTLFDASYMVSVETCGILQEWE